MSAQNAPPASNTPDPLDSPDYDPIEQLNLIFAHPSTLNAVSPIASSLKTHLASLDSEIAKLSATQAATNADSLERISTAKADLSALFDNIENVRGRAAKTEEAITAMTSEIKKLDSTKRNLTLSMTMLKRLQMLTTAFDQLKSSTRSRQYRECASLLAAVLELMDYFKSYRSISQIATLSRSVADVKNELLEQICEDFEMAFVKGEVPARRSTLAEGCLVIDALGESAKQRLLNWYCNTQLREYRQVFRGNDEAGSLDNISRRYSWFKRMLKVYDDEHASIFPTSWKAGEALTNAYCDGTKEDYKGILARSMRKESGQSLDVNLLLEALRETLEFEHFLERRFNMERASLESTSSKDGERPLVFGKAISQAFEPYLSLWVDHQDRTLSQMIVKYRSAPLQSPDSEDDFNSASSVLPSSIELFHFYRSLFASCAKMSTGSKLLDLARVFGKYLDEYAESVLLSYLAVDRVSSLNLEELSIILNTADYCHTTTKQLSDRITARIDKPLSERISFEQQSDAFSTVISKVITILVHRVTSTLDPVWREMRNSPWSRMENVGDQSSYVSVLIQRLHETSSSILSVIAKDAWRRTFCDRTVDAVINLFTANLAQCKPISPVGAEQMLLDLYAIKKSLEDLITLRSSSDPTTSVSNMDTPPAPLPPQSYIKHVTRTVSRLDAILKTLQVATTPQEGLVQAYFIHIADCSPVNFRKILDLKGIRKVEQPTLLELFKVHLPKHRDNLVESHPLLQNMSLSPPGTLGIGIGAPGGDASGSGVGAGGIGSGPGGSKGGFEHLSAAVLAAAKDGVERLQKEREEDGRGSGLGRLFRRDGSGGLRFGRGETG